MLWKNQLDRKLLTSLMDDCFKLSIPAEAKVAFVKYIQATFTVDRHGIGLDVDCYGADAKLCKIKKEWKAKYIG